MSYNGYSVLFPGIRTYQIKNIKEKDLSDNNLFYNAIHNESIVSLSILTELIDKLVTDMYWNTTKMVLRVDNRILSEIETNISKTGEF